MNFPDNFLKGIPNKDFIINNSSVSTHLFYFSQERVDGSYEQSINWEDDDLALQFTLKQKKADNSLQFKYGVAKVPRTKLDELITRPAICGKLSYERDKLPENPYHGNILLGKDVSKPQMKQIAAGIALTISEVIPNEKGS